MGDWLRNRNLAVVAIVLCVLLLASLLLAGFLRLGVEALLLLLAAAVFGGAAFLLVALRFVPAPWSYGRRPAHVLEKELGETREQIFQLAQELRRKADQLTAERDRAEFLRASFADLSSSLDPRHVLRGILQRAIQMAGARCGSILLFDEQGRPGATILSRSAGQEPLRLRTEEIMDRGLAGWVVRHRRGDLIFDTAEVTHWLRFTEDEEQARSAVAVPFLRRERVLGVMVLTHPIPFQFTETHLTLLEELAQHAAVCLENADLYTMAEGERRKLAAILDGTTDAVVAVDMAGRILLLNRAAGRAFGVSPEETLGRPLAEGIAHEELSDLFSQALARNEAVTGELSTADERVRFCSISPVPGVGWVAILQDITYLKELDRVKSDFVSTVSHDLRSPLTAVRGYVDMVPVLGPLSDGQQETLEKIRRAITRMDELISDLLDLGKIEAGIDMEMSPCQLPQVVAEVVESFGLSAELKGLDLQVEVEAGLPAVLGNPARLQQVVSNLVSNAIKYTPAGGRIRVRVGRHKGIVIVAVSDTGIGIAPEDQGQLFQKFYRVQTEGVEDVPGTGLGLAICRSIVEQHGGRIWVRSAPGQGSTFAFALPVLVQPEEPEQAGGEQMAAEQGEGKAA